MPTTTESGPVQIRSRRRCKSQARHRNSHTKRTSPRGLHTANGSTEITNGQGLAFATTPTLPAASFSHDALGNLTPTADTANLVVTSTGYSPYGTPTTTTNNAVAFGYRQQLHLGNQIELPARSYDPSLGRFTSRDPIDGTPGLTVNTNPYHYANNDPINHTDPSGLNPSTQDNDVNPWAAVGSAALACETAQIDPRSGSHGLKSTVSDVGLTCTAAFPASVASIPNALAAACGVGMVINGGLCGYKAGPSPADRPTPGSSPEPSPQPTQPRPAPSTSRGRQCPVGEVGSYGALRLAKAGTPNCEAHHIIQDKTVNGWVRDYSRDQAPAIVLTRDQHVRANSVQRTSQYCGTYQAERQVARQALERAGQPLVTIGIALQTADNYFMGQLGVDYGDALNRPVNRPSCWAAAG